MTMRYLLAIVFPPLAVLLCGKPLTAVLNFILWCLFIVPGIVHGLLVVNAHYADKRTEKVLRAIA